ncbi:MAG: prepilin-type N-terminal cleavage/methylation domain-containing protein [Bdellovibrionota bacterium]
MRQTQVFTLIELMVTIVIIGVLSSIAVGYNAYVKGSTGRGDFAGVDISRAAK